MNKMKKISIITIILYFFFITNCLAANGTVTVSAARLRKEANTTSEVITNIYKDEKVEILETQGEWYKVKYGNSVGYLKNNLITEDVISNASDISQTTDTPESNIDSTKLQITSITNARYVPSITSNSIIQLEVGKKLTKVSELGKWIQVTDGVFYGWVLKNKTNFSENDHEVITSDENSNVNEEDTDVKNSEIEEPVEDKTSNTVAENTQTSNINKTAKVNVETAKVRENANSSAKVKGFLDYNDVITIVAEEGEWYQFTEASISGYVHKTLVTIIGDKEETVTSRSLTEERTNDIDNTTVDETTNNVLTETLSNNSNSNAQTVVDYAKQYLGYPYVVGGKNPDSGFDCSGFTRYVFLNFGYSLGATAATQNSLGTEVSRSDLQPGDLILFYDDAKTKIGHTGIYISNGDFIHAANPTRGVVIDNLNTNSYYNERYVIARRIVE